MRSKATRIQLDEGNGKGCPYSNGQAQPQELMCESAGFRTIRRTLSAVELYLPEVPSQSHLQWLWGHTVMSEPRSISGTCPAVHSWLHVTISGHFSCDFPRAPRDHISRGRKTGTESNLPGYRATTISCTHRARSYHFLGKTVMAVCDEAEVCIRM